MNPEEKLKYQGRLVIFYVGVVAMMLVLLAGLANLQLAQSDAYVEKEKIQNHRRILTPGPRGNIYDREGRVLVSNQAKFSAVVFLSDSSVREAFRKEYWSLARDLREQGVPFSSNELQKQARAQVIQSYLNDVNRMIGRTELVDASTLSRHFNMNPLLPYPIIEDLNREEFAVLLESLPIESPVQVYVSSTRFYPYESAAAHTLGFVSNALLEAKEEELPGGELKTFASKGTYGRDGVEKQFDETLHGKTGMEIWVVDPAGFQVERESRVYPEKGNDVYLSLDIDLQLAAERSFDADEKTGALVAMDIDSRELLAVVSKPDYNLNDTTPRFKADTVKQINEEGAWLNRAIQGLYPPGSPFKLVTAIAGLKHGVIDASTTFVCNGYERVGNRNFPCHNRAGHGEVDVRNAIRASCNVFFYNVGLETGVDALSETAMLLGLNRQTGIDLPNETNGFLVPTREWKLENRGGSWSPGDTANMSIGQGFLIVSPLQMCLAVASIAKNEILSEPTVLKRTPEEIARLPRGPSLGLSREKYGLLVQGMELAVALGTGRNSRIAGVRVAGKTGTAQVRVKDGTLEMAWFVAFAPIDNPRIAIAVIAEGTEVNRSYGGSIYAAPIAQSVLQAFFDKHPELREEETATASVSPF